MFYYVTIMRYLWRHTCGNMTSSSSVLYVPISIKQKGCISCYIPLPQIISLQRDTQALKICSQLLKRSKPKMPEKSQKQNKLATVHFTTYYPSTNYTFTKRHPSIKNYVPSYSKWLSQKFQKKSQKQNKLATVHFTTYYPFTNYTFTKGHSSIKNMFPATQKE